MISFTPSTDLESAIAKARIDVECWDGALGGDKEAKWVEWAGNKLPEMMRDRELTIQSLESPDVGIRLTAACMLGSYWKASERFASHVLRAAFEDPEPAVRGAALFALLLLRTSVSDPTGFLGKLLVKLFPPPSKFVRAAAVRNVEETRQRVNIGMTARWERLAGTHAARMRESRATAESYLTHPDGEVRRAALLALDTHWKPDRAFEESCERLIFDDLDVKVRALAVSCLGNRYSRSDDPRVGRLAARLVGDGSAPQVLRATAYVALFTIRGLPTEAFLAAHRARSRFPEGVDWAFVDSFLNDGP